MNLILSYTYYLQSNAANPIDAIIHLGSPGTQILLRASLFEAKMPQIQPFHKETRTLHGAKRFVNYFLAANNRNLGRTKRRSIKFNHLEDGGISKNPN